MSKELTFKNLSSAFKKSPMCFRPPTATARGTFPVSSFIVRHIVVFLAFSAHVRVSPTKHSRQSYAFRNKILLFLNVHSPGIYP